MAINIRKAPIIRPMPKAYVAPTPKAYIVLLLSDAKASNHIPVKLKESKDRAQSSYFPPQKEKEKNLLYFLEN